MKLSINLELITDTKDIAGHSEDSNSGHLNTGNMCTERPFWCPELSLSFIAFFLEFPSTQGIHY